MSSVRDAGPVGVVGSGSVSRATVGALARSGAHVAWIVDPDNRAREALLDSIVQHQPDAPQSFGSLDEALRYGMSGTPVLVNSPATIHLDHIEQCARAKRPMLVAKPLATSYSDGERALAIAADHSVGLVVAEQYPFERHAVAVRGVLREIGPVRRLFFDHRKPASSQSTLSSKRQTGIIEFAVHHYAVLTSWLGEVPEAISADTWTNAAAASGTGSVGHSWIRYADCHVSHAFGFGGARPVYRLEMECEGGTASAAGSHFAAPDVTLDVHPKPPPHTESAGQPLAPDDAWFALFSDWLDSPVTHTRPSHHREVLTVLAMMDAALSSVDTDSVITVAGNARYAALR